MKNTTLIVTATTPENASLSWGGKTAELCKKLPVHAVMSGILGGYYESIDKFLDFLHQNDNRVYVCSPEFNGHGEYTVKVATKKEAARWGWESNL